MVADRLPLLVRVHVAAVVHLLFVVLVGFGLSYPAQLSRGIVLSFRWIFVPSALPVR